MKERKIKSIAKEVINDEINALIKLKSSIGKSIEQTVKTILNNKNGKVIISGVGKSGIISKKWAATFSSTGTPSFFMDASNASHGDMGQISSNDIVILISLSGERDELKNIIQYTSIIKNIKLIGVTSKKAALCSFSRASVLQQQVLPPSLSNKRVLAQVQIRLAVDSIPTFSITRRFKAPFSCKFFQSSSKGSLAFIKKVWSK